MKKIKESNGITLIVLVITIIIILIIAGIAITQLSENGIIGKAKLAKEKTEYTSAKEIIRLKLMEIHADCVYEGNDYTIKEIASSMKSDTKITIEKYYNGNIALIKDGITENLENLQGIIVSANDYSKYKFLITKSRDIEKVTTEEIKNTTSIEDLEPIEKFEENLFGNKPNIDDNEDGILNSRVLEYPMLTSKGFMNRVDDDGNYYFDKNVNTESLYSLKLKAYDRDSETSEIIGGWRQGCFNISPDCWGKYIVIEASTGYLCLGSGESDSAIVDLYGQWLQGEKETLKCILIPNGAYWGSWYSGSGSSTSQTYEIWCSDENLSGN